MADSKISALPASTTPLAGTEVLPIVQSSTTRQVSVANLTAGRAISATQLTLTTGNLIVASGQGVDFSATPGTGTSELLADYEEGTWTPTLGGGWTGFSEGRYTKVGNLVHIYGAFDAVTALNAGSTDTVSGLPFTSVTNPPSGAGFAGPVSYFGNLAALVVHLQCYVARGSTNLRFTSMTVAGTTATNNTAIFGNGAAIYFAATYIAA